MASRPRSPRRPITAEVAGAGLIRLFGKENVVEEQVEVNDGGSQFGTVVYKRYADRQVIVVWRDDKPEEGLAWLLFCPSRTRNCRWHTMQQIRIGTTLKRLEEMNGGPFTISGFEWDGSGAVISFRSGALKALKPSCGAVMLALNPADDLNSKQAALIEPSNRSRAALRVRIYIELHTNKTCEPCKKGYANDDCAETGGSLNVR